MALGILPEGGNRPSDTSATDHITCRGAVDIIGEEMGARVLTLVFRAPEFADSCVASFHNYGGKNIVSRVDEATVRVGTDRFPFSMIPEGHVLSSTIRFIVQTCFENGSPRIARIFLSNNSCQCLQIGSISY